MILVLNAGASTLKYGPFDVGPLDADAAALVAAIADETADTLGLRQATN